MLDKSDWCKNPLKVFCLTSIISAILPLTKDSWTIFVTEGHWICSYSMPLGCRFWLILRRMSLRCKTRSIFSYLCLLYQSKSHRLKILFLVQGDDIPREYLFSYHILHSRPCYITNTNKESKQKSQKSVKKRNYETFIPFPFYYHQHPVSYIAMYWSDNGRRVASFYSFLTGGKKEENVYGKMIMKSDTARFFSENHRKSFFIFLTRDGVRYAIQVWAWEYLLSTLGSLSWCFYCPGNACPDQSDQPGPAIGTVIPVLAS